MRERLLHTPLLTAAALLPLVAAAPTQPPTVTVVQRDSLRSIASAASVSLSADGRLVALTSYAPLAPSDHDQGADVYLLDVARGEIAHLSTGTAEGRPIESDCGHPRVSADGRYVVFQVTFLRAEGSTSGDEPVLYDRTTRTLRTPVRGRDGAPPDGWAGSAAISADGSVVAFVSTATNLVIGPDANGPEADVYVVRPQNRAVRRVSVDRSGAQQPGASVTPSISDDGTRIAFTSRADLTHDRGAARRRGGAARPVSRVFVRDLLREATTAVPRAPLDGNSMSPVISGDGRFVAFASEATGLAAEDRNRSSDVFLYELQTGVVTLVSRGAGGRPANGASLNPAISRDGRHVAFQSDASDVGCPQRCPAGFEDINLLPDVFVFDRISHVIARLSAGEDGPWMEESAAPAIDAGARTVAFSSRHPIRPNDLGHDFDLFLRPLTAAP